MLIKAGSTLIVPRSAKVQEDVAAVVADTGHLSFQPEIVTRRTVVRAGRRDTVASIARRYRVSADGVADWNDVRDNHTFPRGASVVVYVQVRAASTARVGSGAARASVVRSQRNDGPVRVSGKQVVRVSTKPTARAPSKPAASTREAGKQAARDKVASKPAKKKQ